MKLMSKPLLLGGIAMRSSNVLPSLARRYGPLQWNSDKCSQDSISNIRSMSGCSSKLKEHMNIVESAKSNLLKLGNYHVTSPNHVSEETIKSYTILNHNKKDLEFFKPGIGVVNIDLFANPILKEKFAAVPSVSKILNDTLSPESKQALNRWKVRMIATMGNEKFQQYYKEQLDRGKVFHSSVKGHLMGQPSVIEKTKDSLCIKSIGWVLKDLTDIAAVESFVIHSPLGYKGIFDCVAKYKGKPVLIEWKHSSKRKNKIEATYDAPIQMTAYMGALAHDKNYNYHVNNGLIVVAHEDGSRAEVFEINPDDCQIFWAQWLNRVRKYIALNQKKDVPHTP